MPGALPEHPLHAGAAYEQVGHLPSDRLAGCGRQLVADLHGALGNAPEDVNAYIAGAGTMIDQPITQTLETNFMPYAMSIIVSRAIPEIEEVRGKGLMIGLEFKQPVKELRSRLLFEQHVFTGASGTNVIRLLPPLTLTCELADEFLRRLKSLL